MIYNISRIMKSNRLKIISVFIILVIVSCKQDLKPLSENSSVSTPDARIIATIYDSGFEHGHDTYNGISSASDGKIYYVLCSQLMDVAGQMYSYDPKARIIEHLGDLTEICGEKDLKTVAQGKSHVQLTLGTTASLTAWRKPAYRQVIIKPTEGVTFWPMI